MQVTPLVERTLTESDHARLGRLVAQQPRGPATDTLQEQLDACELVPASAVPDTLVTLGSCVLVQDIARDAPPYELTLCDPADARPAEGCISVLSPVGASLLGLRVGTIARWRTPAGKEGSARILAVLFQPEAGREVSS